MDRLEDTIEKMAALAAPHFRSAKAIKVTGPLKAVDGSAGFLVLHKIGTTAGNGDELNVSAFVAAGDAALLPLTPASAELWIIVDISEGWSVNSGEALVAAWKAQWPVNLPPPIIHGKP